MKNNDPLYFYFKLISSPMNFYDLNKDKQIHIFIVYLNIFI